MALPEYGLKMVSFVVSFTNIRKYNTNYSLSNQSPVYHRQSRQYTGAAQGSYICFKVEQERKLYSQCWC